MTVKLNKTNCTNEKWLGRAQCEKCHIRYMMLFSDLPETAFNHLLHPINHFLFPAGSTLLSAGNNAKAIYSIRHGIVKLVHTAQDGTQRIVRLLGPGACIGLELLDGSSTYHYSAVGLSKIDLCKIPIETIQQLETEHPSLSKQIRNLIQEQLDLADQWIIQLGSGPAKQRVAQLLIIMSENFSDKNSAFILLSREDMAAIIGIAFENISRLIAEFKRLTVLTKTDDGLYTCDLEALQDIVLTHK